VTRVAQASLLVLALERKAWRQQEQESAKLPQRVSMPQPVQ